MTQTGSEMLAWQWRDLKRKTKYFANYGDFQLDWLLTMLKHPSTVFVCNTHCVCRRIMIVRCKTFVQITCDLQKDSPKISVRCLEYVYWQCGFVKLYVALRLLEAHRRAHPRGRIKSIFASWQLENHIVALINLAPNQGIDLHKIFLTNFNCWFKFDFTDQKSSRVSYIDSSWSKWETADGAAHHITVIKNVFARTKSGTFLEIFCISWVKRYI